MRLRRIGRRFAAAAIVVAALGAMGANAAIEPVFYTHPIGPGAPRADRLMSPEAAALHALARAWQLRSELLAAHDVDFGRLFSHFPKAVAARRAILRAAGAADDTLVSFDHIQVPRPIVELILRAAAATGADPVYLMALADKESGFSADAKARTSSAEGMFQFIDTTWLKMIKAYGDKYGLVAEAAAISMQGGEPAVADPAMRRSILALRCDPYLSALMAGELARKNGAILAGLIGRQPTEAEAYLAHFFGIDHAEDFVALLQDKPGKAASKEFPAAAHANRTLFFARAGRRRKSLSVTQVFDKIDAMMAKRVSRYQDIENDALGFADPSM